MLTQVDGIWDILVLWLHLFLNVEQSVRYRPYSYMSQLRRCLTGEARASECFGYVVQYDSSNTKCWLKDTMIGSTVGPKFTATLISDVGIKGGQCSFENVTPAAKAVCSPAQENDHDYAVYPYQRLTTYNGQVCWLPGALYAYAYNVRYTLVT